MASIFNSCKILLSFKWTKIKRDRYLHSKPSGNAPRLGLEEETEVAQLPHTHKPQNIEETEENSKVPPPSAQNPSTTGVAYLIR